MCIQRKHSRNEMEKSGRRDGFYSFASQVPCFACWFKIVRGRLVCVFKRPFLVFKQHFTHFNALFHPHVFPQMFSNNNFQFLNTYTKRPLYFSLYGWSIDSISAQIVQIFPSKRTLRKLKKIINK